MGLGVKPSAGLLAAVLFVSCSSGRAEVDWQNYAPSVRQRIDEMAAGHDCFGLQNEFDTADGNDDVQRARTGDGNADLMGYIDSKMKNAGCYAK
jgi:hypothetical protein